MKGKITCPHCGKTFRFGGPSDYSPDTCPRCNHSLAQIQPKVTIESINFNDITSGLGIGGVGSDDYNINTEQPAPHVPTGNPRPNGGGQLWEPCPRCGEEPVHVDCGYCDRHCQC